MHEEARTGVQTMRQFVNGTRVDMEQAYQKKKTAQDFCHSTGLA